MKTQLTKWEKIFVNDMTAKGLISKTHKHHLHITSKKQSSYKWVENMGRHFSKENMQMANWHMKRCSTLLIIREMQIKTAMRYYFTPVRMLMIKNTRNIFKDVEKRVHLYIVDGNVNWCSHWKTVWSFLRKVKAKLSYVPAAPLLGIYLEKMKTLNSKRFIYPSVQNSIIYNSGSTEAT